MLYFSEFQNSVFRTFYMLFCGIEECKPLHSFGPIARNCYLLHFCLEGEGFYRVKDKVYNIKKGQGFLIMPGEITFYQADEKNPWTYIWIAMSGSRTEEYLKLCGLDSDNLIFKSENGANLKNYIEIMLKQKDIGIKNEFFIQGILFQFISELILPSGQNNKSVQNILGKNYNIDNLYIQKAMEFINLNYNGNLTVNEIANYLNIHRSYLTYIFKKNLNFTPQEFLIKFKSIKAAELLHTTDYSIQIISDMLGYSSESSFCKAFKKSFGVNPTKYRKDELYNFNDIKI